MKDWRKQGKHTVLGKITGYGRKVQASNDEVVFIKRNGEIADVFSEGRKNAKSFFEYIFFLVWNGS